MKQKESQKEVEAINKLLRSRNLRTMKCSSCNGSGRMFAPLYGDINLGYVDVGKCESCKGEGLEKW